MQSLIRYFLLLGRGSPFSQPVIDYALQQVNRPS